MKKNNIGYLLREGFRGVFLHGFMSFAAICVTVACLIIMGSFCLILYNTSAMVKELESENEMLVYIDENYSEAKAKSVGSQINLITNVRSATFVSRDQELRRWKRKKQPIRLPITRPRYAARPLCRHSRGQFSFEADL